MLQWKLDIQHVPEILNTPANAFSRLVEKVPSVSIYLPYYGAKMLSDTSEAYKEILRVAAQITAWNAPLHSSLRNTVGRKHLRYTEPAYDTTYDLCTKSDAAHRHGHHTIRRRTIPGGHDVQISLSSQTHSHAMSNYFRPKRFRQHRSECAMATYMSVLYTDRDHH